MKRTLTDSKISLLSLAAVLSAGMLFATGCEDETLVVIDVPPPAPQGVYTIRGDQQVTIYWLPVEADDFDHYRVYWGADSASGSVFNLVGTTVDEMYVDDVDLVNGTRYYYVVTAVDHAGNESAQSREWGGATPRDEGAQILAVSNDDPSNAGFNLATGQSVSFNSPIADFWFDRDIDGNIYINADSIANPFLGDLQDMGYTESLDEIGRAPVDGWSILGYAEVIEGHTYVIWTQDDRYAKVRIRTNGIIGSFVTFDYAYQPGEAWAGGGEPELAPSARDTDTISGARDGLRTGAVKVKATASGGAQ
ncbi:MAG TPA: hypothetical protein VLB27_06350 [candidate division Zixibacteria bacterium]|nr:hypothetical protein [candidate division Zixibacteria bacterium]